MKKTTRHLLLCCMAAPFLLGSCVSKGSDLDLSKDISLDVHVGGEQMLFPIGCLAPVYLDSIIEINEEDPDAALCVLDGNVYGISFKGSFDKMDFEIDGLDLNIGKIDIAPVATDFGLSIGDYDIPVTSICTDISSSTAFSVNDKIDDAVLQVNSLTLYDDAPVNFAIKFQGMPESINEIRLEDMTITFPDFLKIRYDGSDSRVVLNGNSLVMNGKAGSAELASGGNGLVVSGVYVTGLDFKNAVKPVSERGVKRFKTDGTVLVEGRLFIENQTVNTSKLSKLKLLPELSLGSMGVAGVSGIFDPEIDPVDETLNISLGEDGEFFKDKDNVMEFEDVRINIDLTTNFSIPMGFNLSMGSEYEDGSLIVYDISPDDGSIKIPAAPIGGTRTTHVLLYSAEMDVPQSKDTVYVRMSRLPELLKTVPGLVFMRIQPFAVQDAGLHYADLSKGLEATGRYGLEVPMRFNKLKLNYSDTFDGLAKDLEDISDYMTTDVKASVTAKFVNAIPLGLKLAILPVDRNGQAIDGMSVSEIEIAAGSIEQNAESDIELKLDMDGGSLSKLDGFTVNLDCSSDENSDGVELRPDQFFSIEDILLVIDGGFDIDLNDLD